MFNRGKKPADTKDSAPAQTTGRQASTNGETKQDVKETKNELPENSMTAGHVSVIESLSKEIVEGIKKRKAWMFELLDQDSYSLKKIISSSSSVTEIRKVFLTLQKEIEDYDNFTGKQQWALTRDLAAKLDPHSHTNGLVSLSSFMSKVEALCFVKEGHSQPYYQSLSSDKLELLSSVHWILYKRIDASAMWAISGVKEQYTAFYIAQLKELQAKPHQPCISLSCSVQ